MAAGNTTTPRAAGTGNAADERPPSRPPAPKSAEALARLRAGNTAGGKANGYVGIEGLDKALIDVSTAEARHNLLAAVIEAAAEGRATAALTDSIVKAVKVSDMTSTRRLEEQLEAALAKIDEQEQELNQLRRLTPGR